MTLPTPDENCDCPSCSRCRAFSDAMSRVKRPADQMVFGTIYANLLQAEAILHSLECDGDEGETEFLSGDELSRRVEQRPRKWTPRKC